ncbi:hypothetical protein MF672_009135 [Actinomadura sp. ATCC 31491]|uniref:Secreted protein n=1 Tax=Actinomadura luzonensis TaxID=2805427 RepID=A0ABT0FNR9_9ACTN|nr:hypothetical protein [Actinomadura luzonensis]MCK2213952.1 hypothetical protein [Actinomadura luzonensis]
MFKKLAIGTLAAAATTALALSMSGAALADSPHYDDYSSGWGPLYSKNYQAKAQGTISVNWDGDGESNEVQVYGRLWDRDNRSYDEGGKCAYIRFQAEDFDHDWSPVYSKKYCGYPGYKKFFYQDNDVYSVRAQVCQIGLYSKYPTKCGYWQDIYSVDGDE